MSDYLDHLDRAVREAYVVGGKSRYDAFMEMLHDGLLDQRTYVYYILWMFSESNMCSIEKMLQGEPMFVGTDNTHMEADIYRMLAISLESVECTVEGGKFVRSQLIPDNMETMPWSPGNLLQALRIIIPRRNVVQAYIGHMTFWRTDMVVRNVLAPLVQFIDKSAVRDGEAPLRQSVMCVTTREIANVAKNMLNTRNAHEFMKSVASMLFVPNMLEVAVLCACASIPGECHPVEDAFDEEAQHNEVPFANCHRYCITRVNLFELQRITVLIHDAVASKNLNAAASWNPVEEARRGLSSQINVAQRGFEKGESDHISQILDFAEEHKQTPTLTEDLAEFADDISETLEVECGIPKKIRTSVW